MDNLTEQLEALKLVQSQIHDAVIDDAIKRINELKRANMIATEGYARLRAELNTAKAEIGMLKMGFKPEEE